jgi:hypothetical protein
VPFRSIAAERATAASLAATTTVTWLAPCPVAGATCTQPASGLAFHAHSRSAETFAGTVAPSAGTVAGNPLRLVAHLTALGPVDVESELPPQPPNMTMVASTDVKRTLGSTSSPPACDWPTRRGLP